MNWVQKLGLIYLYLLPPVVAAIGFGIGKVSYSTYLPVWSVNVCLMLVAVWQLTKRSPKTGEIKHEGWTTTGLFLIIPWMLFSVFAGMGPPPVQIAGWLATATEQQVRYTILIFGGISAFMGFSLLKIKLQDEGEYIYSTLGFTILGVAIPLFILNMVFWGYYLTDAFRSFVTLPIGKRPDWYPPVKMFFYIVSILEVTLTYFAIVLFALALKKTRILSNRASYWYIVVAIVCIVLVVLPTSLPEPFSTASYLAAVPAIPFIMPYLIGVRLLHFNSNR